jgi:hypothetical protein
VSDTTPAVPQLGQKCPLGHEYAKRTETTPQGVVDVVFCPACEGLGVAISTGGVSVEDVAAAAPAIANAGVRLAPPQAG